MKILILSVTAGQGHNATAKAIACMLEERGHQTQIVDTFLRAGRMLYEIVSKGYLLSSSEFKLLYGKFYYRLEKRKSNSFMPSVARFSYKAIAKKIHNAIEEYDPDAIISTHCFSSMVLDIVKQRYSLRAKTVGVVTDFVMHPYWEEALRLDRLVIANELLIPAAVRKGFTQEQILPTGIPINPKFSTKVDQKEARRRLGLDPNKPTLLMMSGSMGYGNMVKVIKELDKMETNFQIIVVCGSNKDAYRDIAKESWQKTLLNIGFSDEVELLMDAADCIISKPGGLTTSESLAKNLPMIICNPIAGQEERNTEFLQNCGAAMAISGAYSLTDAVYQFFHFPKLIESMHQSIDIIRKPNATCDLCDVLEQLAAEEAETAGA
jgi:processive 1,2-diacylglycerol beta-glucosyltransferase